MSARELFYVALAVAAVMVGVSALAAASPRRRSRPRVDAGPGNGTSLPPGAIAGTQAPTTTAPSVVEIATREGVLAVNSMPV